MAAGEQLIDPAAVDRVRNGWTSKADTDPRLRLLSPHEVRCTLGDGNYGGAYQRSDEEMLAIWQVAVEETRSLIEGPWA